MPGRYPAMPATHQPGSASTTAVDAGLEVAGRVARDDCAVQARRLKKGSAKAVLTLWPRGPGQVSARRAPPLPG